MDGLALHNEKRQQSPQWGAMLWFCHTWQVRNRRRHQSRAHLRRQSSPGVCHVSQRDLQDRLVVRHLAAQLLLSSPQLRIHEEHHTYAQQSQFPYLDHQSRLGPLPRGQLLVDSYLDSRWSQRSPLDLTSHYRVLWAGSKYRGRSAYPLVPQSIHHSHLRGGQSQPC